MFQNYGGLDINDNGIYIYNLGVIPDYRKKGIATYILDYILSINCKYFYLWIKRNNIN